ncbi:MAG: TetR/AcrR family transcriptional regulator [Chitinophagales bacterium]
MAKQKVDEQLIIKESLKLFRSKSYHTTSMSDIAKACGILKGSLYHYFSSKEQLMMKVIETVHKFFKAEVFSIAYNEELDVFERMEKMMARAEKIFIDEETGSVDGNIGVETALVIPEFRPIIQAFFADFIKAIKHLYLSEFEEPKANGLAIRAVSEIEGSLMLSRVFNDKKYLQKTLKRLIKRIER